MKRLGLLAALVLPLLLVALPSTPFWFDEVFTANLVTFQQSPATVVRLVAEKDAHPPLFYLEALAWSHLVGTWGKALEGPPPDVEVKSRRLSLLNGALASAAVAASGPVGVLALWGSPDWWLKVREYRMYPLLGLFWVLALLAAWRRRPTLAAWAGLGALLTQYLAFVLLVPLYLWLWWTQGFRWRALTAYWPLLLFLVQLPTLLSQLGRGAANPLIRPDPLIILTAFNDFGGYGLGLALVALLLLTALFRRHHPQEAVFYLLPFFGMVLWWGASLVVNLASLRYLGAIMPPAAFVLGLASQRWNPALRVGMLALLAASAAGTALWPPPPLNEHYDLARAILRKVEEKSPPPPVLYGDSRGRLIALRYYHRGPTEFQMIAPDSAEKAAGQAKSGIPVFLYHFGPAVYMEIGRYMDQAYVELRELGCWNRYLPLGVDLYYFWCRSGRN